MKIGIDIRPIGKKRTGDEAYFFGLVKNLAIIDKKNEYFLYTDCDPEQDFDLKKEIGRLELGKNFKVIFLKSPNRFCWNAWVLPLCLRRNPVDIFHTQYIAPFWLPKKVKLVLTIHDISFNFFPQFIKFSDLFFLRTLIPRSLKMARMIIAVSEFTRQEIEKFYKISAEKIAAVYNGADFERFNKRINTRRMEEIRRKYKLPEKFVLYIGTLQPRKNIPVAIEAMGTLRDKHKMSGIRMVVAGNRKAHNFDPKIDKTIKNLQLGSEVVFSGWIDEDDKPALFQLADCFVFPSLYEGFGIPIVDAMAAGTPVVCSDIPVFREIAGDAALFSDPRDSGEYAKMISKAIEDEEIKNNLIQKGLTQAKKFTWRGSAEKILRIYELIGE
jgi:glycosyltransferase involved in cell wall biosynthesis